MIIILCLDLKGHSTRILRNCEKIFKNMFTNMTLLQFLQLIRLRKSKRKKYLCFPLRIQILAILFRVDCTINQFVTSRGGVEDTRLEAKAKDSLSEDRHSRGQGQECLRPRPRTKDTSASALQNHKNFLGDLKKKKKVFTKIFLAISTKKRFPKNFSSASENFSNSKNSAVLEPRTGQFLRT